MEETFDFTANGASSLLGFLSTDNLSTSGGPVIDNVGALTVTPEPGSLALVCLALAGVALFEVSRRLVWPR